MAQVAPPKVLKWDGLDNFTMEVVADVGFLKRVEETRLYKMRRIADEVCELTAWGSDKKIAVETEEFYRRWQREAVIVDKEIRKASGSIPMLATHAQGPKLLIKRCLELEGVHLDPDAIARRKTRSSNPAQLQTEGGSLDDLTGSDSREFGIAFARTDWVEVASPNRHIRMSYKFQPRKHLFERVLGLGRAECNVDCAAEEVGKWMFFFCGNERAKMSTDKGNVARFVVSEKSKWDHVIATVKKAPVFFSDREFVFRIVAAKTERGEYVIGAEVSPASMFVHTVLWPG